MPPLIRGRLLSSAFAADVLPSLELYAVPSHDVRIAMERCAEQIDSTLGPAASARNVVDVSVLPLLTVLQFSVSARQDTPRLSQLHTVHGHDAGPLFVITAFGEPLERTWRIAVRSAIANDLRWCVCCNGLSIRLVDARRTWSRDYLEFEIPDALRDSAGQALLWTVLRGEACASGAPAVDTLIMQSARHGASVRQALGRGVLDALAQLLTVVGDRRVTPAARFEHSLTMLYRVLFLLFAEARGLVPLWHPLYRDQYSLDGIVTTLLGGRPYRGIWQAIQAISRLAHAGCAAGELRVTAFNGRLFAPAQAAVFDRRPIADPVMARTVIGISSIPGTGGGPRARISYRDLDVEQLGAVYEQVLDYEPTDNRAAPLVRTRDVRKASGAFYTPRALTAHVVTRALEPLVSGRTSDQILGLKVLDPAMGSGAFLVAACRFLAASVEDALVAEGRWHSADITAADRTSLRRTVASRCLYGVDVNPAAVQLGRLSVWLATLAADRPLSFLDHHFVTGDSLVGASPVDVQRQPGGRAGRGKRQQSLPLLEGGGLRKSIAETVTTRVRMAQEPDDSATVVRQKERTLAALLESPTLVNRWRRVLDLWCAGWFWGEEPCPDRGTFGELVRELLDGHSSLSTRSTRPLLQRAEQIAAANRFLHWPLAFPEVFDAGGFDAVIGNPPWDMLRGDSGSGRTRVDRQRQAGQATSFFRESGIYVVASGAHANRYQVFVERILQLVRPGGRIGLVLPGGMVTDAGSASLRRHLFDRADVDAILGLDNRHAIFPIHRSVRFALLTATAGRRTERITCRFGVTRLDDLADAGAETLSLTRNLLARLSGSDDLGIPELRTNRDLRIAERISTSVPWLGHSSGWGVQFGRELNASDDRGALRTRTGAPGARAVVEGKQLEPFRVRVDRSELELPATAPVGRRVPRRIRLAYRDVAGATNRLTLIAALVPASVVTTHTLFCLKTALPLAHQQVLCALLNSLVSNYLIRLRVTTHVTATLMSRLPVPVVRPEDEVFRRLQRLTEILMQSQQAEAAPEYAELQAVTAHLYGLTAEDFRHILSTFPLMPSGTREAAYDAFTREGHDPTL